MNKLLFIDDEEEILWSYKRIFEKTSKKNELKDLASKMWGEDFSEDSEENKVEFSVETASQGEEGVSKFEKEMCSESPFKVVFIDMRMPPGINGLETAKRIRKLDPRVEIVIVTAYSDVNFKDVVKELGTPDKLLYLKKPFDSQEIKQFALNLVVKYKNEMIKDEFVSNVSHELKTPLASILGFQQLLAKLEHLPEDAKEYIRFVGYSARLMKGLVDELLTTVELRNKLIVFEKKKTNMKELVESCYALLDPIVKEKEGVELLFVGDERLDNIFCEVDSMRINQCINNLVSNAIKFTHKGTIEVKLLKEDDYFVISISDTGIGITQDKLAFIFGKFARVENEHHEIPGLGLGLNIVKSIMDAHDGLVTVKSEEGKGSCFQLKFRITEVGNG